MSTGTIRATEWDGGTISKPGVYVKLPLEDYHRGDLCAGPSTSSSGLRRIFNESPADFWITSPLNSERADEGDKRHFILGRATHHLMLGEPFFAKLFCVQPEEYQPDDGGKLKPWNNNAGPCRRWHDEQKENGRAVLTASEIENIKGMARSLAVHPLVLQGILAGDIERSIIWKDKETGIWLKARPDAIPTDSGNFVDLKTTTSVQYLDAQRALREHGYHQQAALIRTGCREVLGFEMEDFTLVLVQKKPPYSVRDFRIAAEDLDRGEQQNKLALRTLWWCLKNKQWPGPGGGREGTETLNLSPREREVIDERVRVENLEGAR